MRQGSRTDHGGSDARPGVVCEATGDRSAVASGGSGVEAGRGKGGGTGWTREVGSKVIQSVTTRHQSISPLFHSLDRKSTTRRERSFVFKLDASSPLCRNFVAAVARHTKSSPGAMNVIRNSRIMAIALVAQS